MFNKCGLVGELPDLLTRHCPNLEVLDLSRNRGCMQMECSQ